jgi:hypothetical protein
MGGAQFGTRRGTHVKPSPPFSCAEKHMQVMKTVHTTRADTCLAANTYTRRAHTPPVVRPRVVLHFCSSASFVSPSSVRELAATLAAQTRAQFDQEREQRRRCWERDETTLSVRGRSHATPRTPGGSLSPTAAEGGRLSISAASLEVNVPSCRM